MLVDFSSYVLPISGFDNQLVFFIMICTEQVPFLQGWSSASLSKGSLTCNFILDDSGHWGRGGLFTALEARSDQPRKIYEMAGKMKGKRFKHNLRPRHLKELKSL